MTRRSHFQGTRYDLARDGGDDRFCRILDNGEGFLKHSRYFDRLGGGGDLLEDIDIRSGTEVFFISGEDDCPDIAVFICAPDGLAQSAGR